MRRQTLGFLLGFSITAGLLATPAPAWSSSKAATASCELACDQTLASCEHTKGGTKKRCSRQHASCAQSCVTESRVDRRSATEKKLTLCSQRCDLSRSSCDRANPVEPQLCAAGQKSCLQRCR